MILLLPLRLFFWLCFWLGYFRSKALRLFGR